MSKNLTATVTVDSSAIREVRYNFESQSFFITFQRGKEYMYPDVPEHVFAGFMSASSKGKFLHKFIRDQYNATAV